MKKGAAKVVHREKTASVSAKVYIGHNYNALLVHHYMTGTTTGGHVNITMADKEDGNFIAHHGEGTNIQSNDTPNSYTALFKGVMDYINVDLQVTDGTHTVIIQPINI